jgi:hypothetical protein
MNIDKTITSIFIVPTLKIDKDELKKQGFINGFSIDGERDVQYKDAVYLLFKPTDLDKFRVFLEEQQQSRKDVLDDYDYPDKHVVVVYQLDKKWKKDFALIKEGSYSKTSKKFQELFPKTIKFVRHGITIERTSVQYRIFNKTEDLRDYWEDRLDVIFTDDMEMWDGFHPENETLTLQKLKTEETV